MSSVTGAADRLDAFTLQPGPMRFKPGAATPWRHRRFAAAGGRAILSAMSFPCPRCSATIAGSSCPQCGFTAAAPPDRARRLVVAGAIAFGAVAGLGTWALVSSDGGLAGAATGGADDWTAGWLSNARGYEAASRELSTKRRPMLVYFYTDWCGYCRRLEGKVLATESGRKSLEDVLKVRINPESGRDEALLAGQYRVRGYPTLLVVSPEGVARRARTPQSPAELEQLVRQLRGG